MKLLTTFLAMVSLGLGAGTARGQFVRQKAGRPRVPHQVEVDEVWKDLRSRLGLVDGLAAMWPPVSRRSCGLEQTREMESR
jgi:hypothetical protein